MTTHHKTNYRILAITACLLIAGCVAEPQATSNNAEVRAISEAEQTVLALSEAFNAHDAEALGSYVAEDVIWLGIGVADSVYVEAKGRSSLVAGMTGYFEALPTVRSEVKSPVVTGDFVAFRERVFWESNGEEKTQAALAVYEVRDQLVQRVWYYPTVAD